MPLGWRAALVAGVCAVAPAGLTGCTGNFGGCEGDNTCDAEDDLGDDNSNTPTGGGTASDDDATGSTGEAGGTATRSSGGSGGDGGGDSTETQATGGSGGSDNPGDHPATEGSGGSAGGTGGSTTVGDECSSDADCDDGLFCNGEEICKEGLCAEGETVECENPDQVHCSATCHEGDEAAECIVAPLDADEDGFGTSACEAAPGEDCNDDAADIHPEAEDICDGIDNNCNGLRDLEDGFELPGTSVSVANASQIVADWSEKSGAFGYVHEHDGDFYVGTLLASGTLLEADLLETGNTLLDSSDLMGPRLAWGTDSFGVVGSGPLETWGFGQFTESGGFGEALVSATETGMVADLTARTTGDWVALVRTASSLTPVTVTPIGLDDQETTDFPPLEVSNVNARIASHGNELAVVWQVEKDGEVAGARLSADLGLYDTRVLTESGNNPAVAETSDGFAVAWTTNSGVVVQSYTLGGTLLCEATDLEFEGARFSPDDSVALADTAYGVLAFATYDTGDTRLFRLDDECNVEDAGSLGASDGASQPGLVLGGGHVAAVWSGVSEGVPTGYTRVVSELLCE